MSINGGLIRVQKSSALQGVVMLEGAKNAVLVIMASLILTKGVSILRNVPPSADVFQMIRMLEQLGARIIFDIPARVLSVDTTMISGEGVLDPAIVRTFRASTLVMGPLLARFRHARVAFPGGDDIGVRGIDFHLRAFEHMGAQVEIVCDEMRVHAEKLTSCYFVLEYPSVGATENVMMAAVLTSGVTTIVNAALEPEVLDLISVLRAMGACISVRMPNTIVIEGVKVLQPVDHAVMYDRLEAGTFAIAAAMTGGAVEIPHAPAHHMEVFLEKLRQMGHRVHVGENGTGIMLEATTTPRAVSFRTMPYPGFPTDLQALMMVAQLCAHGTSTIYETVHERRLSHVHQLVRCGADITVYGDMTAIVRGGAQLRGTEVIGGDLRAVASLVLTGLIAEDEMTVQGIEHLVRGYVDFDVKLQRLGGLVEYVTAAVMQHELQFI
jgi:UDP-N-acetylglucosamine 1-carboxyvinyltransferase